MATQLQSRRGTTAQMNAFTGAEGEIAVNTSTDTLHVHDGSTAGGHALAKADGSNIATYAGSFTTLAASGATTLSGDLTVDGTAKVEGSQPRLQFFETDTTDSNYQFRVNGGNLIFNTLSDLGAVTGEVLRIDASGIDVTGNITVGTNDTIFAENNIRFKSTGAAYIDHNTVGQAINFRLSASSSLDTTPLVVNSTGIDVTGTATVVGTTTSGILLKSSSGASNGFKLYNDSGTDTAHLNNHFSGSMVFSTNNTERMRITSAGALELTGPGGAGETFLNFTADSNTTKAQISAAKAGASGGRLVFSTNNSSGTLTERMRIDQNGTLLLTTPFGGAYGYLNIKEAGSGDVRFGKTSGNDYDAIAGTWTNNNFKFYANSTERMRIDSSGRLLVGRTNDFGGSGYKLQVDFGSTTTGILVASSNTASKTALIMHDKNFGPAAGSITYDGLAVQYNTSSDQRLKENIADADDAGSKVDAIQVRKFDWIADGSHQDYGMVAQELQTVAPEAVSASEDPDEMMGVDYSKLVPMMLKEIQSLRARVNALEAE